MTEQEFNKGKSIPMTKEQELNMERFAEFLARMIQNTEMRSCRKSRMERLIRLNRMCADYKFVIGAFLYRKILIMMLYLDKVQ